MDIAYGYEDNDAKTDTTAVRKLTNLIARYGGQVHLHPPQGHPRQGPRLLGQLVITSFDWLSFRGDPERTYRMEEGSLARNRQIANTQYARYLELIDDQRR
ncbi:hypothetical protein ACFC0C_33220 [Streptomyces sp. NPDC056178]|uniref:hypothetical protein n=1 Tax=unclassified Streptomyces TaxID=2593676 RepID=UPI0035DCC7FC